MFGIEKIKIVLIWVLAFAADIPRALADGKFNLKDFPLFIDDVVTAPKMIASLRGIEKEYLNMSVEERTEIDAVVREHVGNPNADVKEVIALAIKTVIDGSVVADDVVDLIAAIKKLKA
jgi:hypothetical protein